jgi:hypothetical protein
MMREQLLFIAFFDVPFLPAMSTRPMKLRESGKLGQASGSSRGRFRTERTHEGTNPIGALD